MNDSKTITPNEIPDQRLTILAPASDPHTMAAMCFDSEEGLPATLLPLTAEETQLLADNETIIEQSLNSWYQVGRALSVIKAGKLYRDKYGSFEKYCRGRWGFGRHRGIQLIATSTVLGENVDNCQHLLPERESHARQLLELPDANARQEVIASVKKAAGNKPVTARKIKTAVNEYLGKATKSEIVDAEILGEPEVRKKDESIIVPTNFLQQESNEQSINRLFRSIREYAGHKKWDPSFEKMVDELEMRIDKLMKSQQLSTAA